MKPSESAELHEKRSAFSLITPLLWMGPFAFIRQDCDSEPPQLDSSSLWSFAG